ncbi:hypothetical protein Ppb6_03991 [Photorhabdus australis subsp. thailandensis]|uniref:Uncharacterized protein n=1 Tax=Photorhabdus australis subsp. thailandensis TaxID=2805096 RepID=A0A1C0TYY9_9GAMM|nr:hypothetical protein Ppb6_03991 [Photorhabdus australis subsp. thailandensis]
MGGTLKLDAFGAVHDISFFHRTDIPRDILRILIVIVSITLILLSYGIIESNYSILFFSCLTSQMNKKIEQISV